ncbi:MAG TPA: 5-formyltetrahydrofolate cyclo-ligase [Steroidobacteraceae bacterium]|nr:5-formyltetrahydrofolate cyclo-ligase [Steroidobacteraceae bacterium]
MTDADAAAPDAALEARRAIMAWRREQRAALLGARQGMATAVHRDASHTIAERLRALLGALQPRVLAGYWPIRREFNPLPLLHECDASGVQVALPVIRVKNEPLEFRRWTPDAPMQVGVYDIPYPADGAVVQPDALLIPMVGFDAAGYRLGYGGGYYDRTVASLLPRPCLIGVCFELSRIESIRPLAHDIRMDHVVTEGAGLERR